MAKVMWNESAMQQNLFAWIDRRAHKTEWMKTIYHPANGGHRHIATAERLKREGVRAGVPDVIIPRPIMAPDGSIAYTGMAIELKVGSNKLSQAQAAFCYALVQQKWFVILVHDFSEVAAYHICKAYDEPMDDIPDYAVRYPDKWASCVNRWSKYDFDEFTKGGFNAR
jgi:hypothetical protein